MARRLHGCVLGVAALLAASCYSDNDGDDDLIEIPDASNVADAAAADAAVMVGAEAGVPRRDGGGIGANLCSGLTDPIQSAVCSIALGALGGGGRDAGGFSFPTDAQCRNATDPLTRAICSLSPGGRPRRDAGAGGGRRDAGADPERDAGSDPDVDAGTSITDAGVQDADAQDAAAEQDAAPEDASVIEDAAADDAAAGDAAVVEDAAVEDAAVEDAAADDAGSDAAADDAAVLDGAP